MGGQIQLLGSSSFGLLVLWEWDIYWRLLTFYQRNYPKKISVKHKTNFSFIFLFLDQVPLKIMSKKGKIISLNDFKENRKEIGPDGNPITGVYTDYYDWENDQKEYEGYYKDGKLNGLSTWWYENGQKEREIRYEDGKQNGLCTWWCENGLIECEGFFKDGIEVDDPRTELDENELPSPLRSPTEFIKYVCLLVLVFLAAQFATHTFFWIVSVFEELTVSVSLPV